jgi:hypothetical protein
MPAFTIISSKLLFNSARILIAPICPYLQARVDDANSMDCRRRTCGVMGVIGGGEP